MSATAFVLTHRSDSDRSRYSASLQALAITRSLGRRGVPVVRVHPGKHELSLASRYCISAEDSPNVYESEPALLKFLFGLAKKHRGPRVLFPASDDTAYFLGRHREALSAAYRVVAPCATTIEAIIDKRRQYQSAAALGIPIPETHFPRDLSEVLALAGTLKGYPYIIKPNVAHRWRLASVKQVLRSSAGVPGKAVIVHDADQLIAEYRQIAEVDPDLMVQKVIIGADERLYGFFGYFDRESRPLGYCLRRKLRQMPLRFGYCTLIESCEDETVVEQSLRLLKGFNYRGIVGVEWKQDPESGQYQLIEINARATNTSALPPACGVDLPYLAFADAIGEPLAPVTRWRTGVKWIWLTQDLWAARELRRQGTLTLLDWLKSLRGPRVHAVYAGDDLRPFLLDYWRFLKGCAERGLRRVARVLGVSRRWLSPRSAAS